MAREGRWSLVAETGNLHGVELFWHSPLWPVFWTNTKAFKWEPWFSVSSPLTVLKVQITAGVVCSAKITHRPFEILSSTLWLKQYQGTEFREPIAPSLWFAGGVLAQKLIHVLMPVLLAGSCKGSGLSKATNPGVLRWWGDTQAPALVRILV